MRAVSELEPSVLPSERLVLDSVEAASPGQISIFGKLNVLEQIRLWLIDRSERQKDREYRNREEERRLDLENQQRETDLIRSRIAALREAGLTDFDVNEVFRRLLSEPRTGTRRYRSRRVAFWIRDTFWIGDTVTGSQIKLEAAQENLDILLDSRNHSWHAFLQPSIPEWPNHTCSRFTDQGNRPKPSALAAPRPTTRVGECGISPARMWCSRAFSSVG